MRVYILSGCAWLGVSGFVVFYVFHLLGCSPLDVYTPTLCDGNVCYVRSVVGDPDRVVDTYDDYRVLFRTVHASWAWVVVTLLYAAVSTVYIRRRQRQRLDERIRLLEDEYDEDDFETVDNIDV